MRGRRTKLTPELQKKITKLIAAGNYKKVAAAACGICEDTFYEWIKRGEKEGKGIYAEFAEAVKKACNEAEARLVVEINRDESWQAKAWLLERSRPERWGRKQQVDVSSGDKPFTINIIKAK